jgi:UDP-2-acetamido-3-amino-2,3-dideoxy-glucuronate N-acetyltransferase
MKKPAVAAVGAGYWGKNVIRALHKLGALACVCDSSEKALAVQRETYVGVRTETDYRAVLDDGAITAVAIASPAARHAEMIRQALEAGKDVYVEKPLCLSESEGASLVALAAGLGRVLMVGHLLHYHDAVVKLKEMISRGELGKVYYIYSNRLNLGKFRSEENALWSFAPHDVSVILGLAGEMPDNVFTSGGAFLQEGVHDSACSVMSFPSGMKAHIFASWLNPFKEQKLVVVGSRKMAVFDDTLPERKLVVYPHVIGWKENFPVPEKKEPEAVELQGSEPLLNEMSHFLKCVTDREVPVTDGAEGLRVLKVLQACQKSLDTGTKVSLSEKEQTYFAHPTAIVDQPAEIGEGTSIWHFTHVMKDCRIGRSCNIGQNVVISSGAKVGDRVKIQNNVSVYTGVVLEDGVFCGPSMVFTNVMNPRSYISRRDEYKETLVKEGATLGANCTVVCGHTIGRFAFVGAGAVVTKDVPDYALVVGNPGRIIGYMCECGARLTFNKEEADCQACGASYEKRGGRVERRQKIESTVA